ncbi:hypothetical protein PHYBOEH_001307 [Phytophthora boehmeriae]|uniref:Uncharacterized protein n=1 Tax=Phytophthora boehmeriae TaxID=109152 RepID=A0A8T1VB38_9STRA|nr:hypothetical protein PHYBOEH_001307 [Phytophthora boehmeriae]
MNEVTANAESGPATSQDGLEDDNKKAGNRSPERCAKPGTKRVSSGTEVLRDETPSSVDDGLDEECPPEWQLLEERLANERASETSEERNAIIAARQHVKFPVLAVSRKLYRSWDNLQRVVKAYQNQ